MKRIMHDQKNEMQDTQNGPIPTVMLDRFQPIRAAARALADQLIQRGGTLVTASRDRVLIRREGVLAEIDEQGRVTWRPAKRS
jgi:hypothetical protein